MNQIDYIERDVTAKIMSLYNVFPVITVTGPRQSGKTTLCRQMFSGLPYLDFERLDVQHAIMDDPNTFILQYPTGAILDEAQRFPDIFSYLKAVVDEDRFQGSTEHRYIVSGSSNFSLLESISQSMAGRTAVITLLPLSVREIEKSLGKIDTDRLMINGGYPAIWRNGDNQRDDLLANYYATYVERDVRRIINVQNLVQFQNFMIMCASRVGSELNLTSISTQLGISATTLKKWLNILIASYVLHLLPPYFSNINKRLIKTPKIYFYDTGLVCHLLGIRNSQELATHPLRGNIFENMVVNEFVKNDYNQGKKSQLFFYRDKTREVDLLRMVGPKRFEAYEIKSSRTYHKEYQSNLKYLQELVPDEIVKTSVVCDSVIENKDTKEAFINFRSIH